MVFYFNFLYFQLKTQPSSDNIKLLPYLSNVMLLVSKRSERKCQVLDSENIAKINYRY